MCGGVFIFTDEVATRIVVYFSLPSPNREGFLKKKFMARYLHICYLYKSSYIIINDYEKYIQNKTSKKKRCNQRL